MNNWIWIILAVITLLPIFYLSVRFLFTEMAKRNMLFTFRTEGEIKAIMNGETVAGFILSIKNYRIDPDGFDLFKGTDKSYATFLQKAAKMKVAEGFGFEDKKLKPPGNGDAAPELTDELTEDIDKANTPTWLEGIFPGIVWVGFPPRKVFTYRFNWLKYGQDRDENGKLSDEMTVHARDEIVSSLYFRYPQYAVVLEGQETKASEKGAQHGFASVRVRCVLVFETETVNPLKSLFRVSGLSSAGDWLTALTRSVSSEARAWIGETNWDTLTGNKVEVEKKLRDIVERINGVDENGVPKPDSKVGAVRDYGQKILKIELVSIDLDQDIQNQIDAVFKARRAAEKAVIDARAESAANVLIAVGQRALAAAPLLGKAKGLKAIDSVANGSAMYVAEQIGRINVFAPGGDNKILLNVDTRPKTEVKPATKTQTEKEGS